MKLKYWKHRIATLRKDLKILFVIAVFSVLIMDLWLINIPEFFSGGAALGSLYYKICLSYITAFIFYFINVHLQNERTKVKTYKYIQNKASKLNYICGLLLNTVRKDGSLSLDSSNSELSIYELCKNINPRKNFHLGGTYNIVFEHWSAGFQFITKESKELIRDLLFIKDTLNSDVLAILTEIDYLLDNSLNIVNGAKLGNEDLTVYSNRIIEYEKLCTQLLDTVDEKYKYHKVEYHEKNNKK
ncbi:hypothetical protein PDN63_23640 [Bacillus cereus]|nr:hypothetical protein [Bacillus cereus]MDA2457328.1 hypothetical protein [Bacillus cereus]